MYLYMSNIEGRNDEYKDEDSNTGSLISTLMGSILKKAIV